MKILSVISHLRLGGAELSIIDLAEVTEESANIYIFTLDARIHDSYSENFLKRARLVSKKVFLGSKIPWKFGGFLFSSLKLLYTVLIIRPNIIQLNTERTEFSYLIIAPILKFFTKTKVMRTIHNTNLWTGWPILGFICERLFLTTPRVYVSKEARIKYYDKFNSVLKSDSVIDEVIYNPIKISDDFQKSQIVKTKNNIKKFLFAGRFEIQKGADLLRKIIPIVQIPFDSSAVLHIYGEGMLKHELEELAVNSPKNWKIKIYPPDKNLLENLKNYDAVLMPSRFEGYGRLAAESLLCNVPVIVFGLRVFDEILPHDYLYSTKNSRIDVEAFAYLIELIIKESHGHYEQLEGARKNLINLTSPRNVLIQYIAFWNKIV